MCGPYSYINSLVNRTVTLGTLRTVKGVLPDYQLCLADLNYDIPVLFLDWHFDILENKKEITTIQMQLKLMISMLQ